MRSILRFVAFGAAAAVLGGCSGGVAPRSEPPPSSAPSGQPPPATLETLSDLPAGKPPRLAYVVAARSVVFPDRSVDLEWDVEWVSAHGFVWDADSGTIHRLTARAIEPIGTDATSPPVFDSTVTWIEGDAAIVRTYLRSVERQPLPAGCCRDARLVGVDVDMNPDVLVASRDGAWLWDTYEGREGLENPPPDSEDYFWPVGGLDGGRLEAVGIGSEVLVGYPRGQWGWGYVAGPRDPRSNAPVGYLEQERVAADRVWLTVHAIIAMDRRGRLVELGSELQYVDGNAWRALTGERAAFALTGGLVVKGVVDESRRAVLVDATDRDGRRAWVRCSLHTYACEIAAELGPDDITPE